jgi:hypothetical protein
MPRELQRRLPQNTDKNHATFTYLELHRDGVTMAYE